MYHIYTYSYYDKIINEITQTYRIDKSHNVNRAETWSVYIDNKFSSKQEARNYVIRMNRRLCGYDLGIFYSDNEELIEERCTDVKWCHKQKYTIGRPNIKLINEYLEKDRG